MGQNLIDFKNLIQSEKFSQIAKGFLGTYEKRVKSFVRDLDLKSRDARSKSREQLDRFTSQLKTTRSELEKRVSTLVNHETDRLNKGLNDLVVYLKTLSKQEAALKARSKKPKAKKSVAGAKRSTSSRPTSKKKVTVQAAPSVN